MNVSLTRFIRKQLYGKLPAFRHQRPLFRKKIGLEIGGPSELFGKKNLLPVYGLAARVDGLNFATKTVWEGQLKDGADYRYAKGKIGRQFIRESTKLEGIGGRSYDFVISCHSLEHTANPLKALAEWKRVLVPRGGMLLVLPDKRFSFDHRRQVTSFRHLLDDYERDMGEDDLTHLDEILELHDGSMDRDYGSAEAFRERSLANADNRCLHHHVFDEDLLRQAFDHLSIQTLSPRIECRGQVIIAGRVG